ncbi:MAG TPA: filamentous hemagglutinin family protein [Candidatus Methylacidiphilales bacterium]
MAANAGGGNAGSLTISAPDGTFIHNGSLLGQGGAGGQGGSFSADVATEDISSALNNGSSQNNAGNELSPLETVLNTGGFTRAQSIRVRGGVVGGMAYNDVYFDGGSAANEVHTGSFNLSADTGSIIVTGTIDASDVAATDATGKPISVGGVINLSAGGNVILARTAVLNVSGATFSNAGKGGAVTLLSGAYRSVNGADVTDYNGYVDIEAGSTIDLRVAANDDANGTVDPSLVAGNAASGDFSGTLQITAPRIGESDVAVKAIAGSLLGASSIAVVGNQVYSATAYGDGTGNIGGSGDDLAAAIMNDGNSFLGTNGTASTGSGAMTGRLFGQLDAESQAVANVETGAEIVNPVGSITLGSDWDLSSFRFGPSGAAGVLTIRAQGNLVFEGSLSDGFTDATNTGVLLPENSALPVNNQSWSYNLAAGADFSAADFNRVLPDNETYDPATGLAVPGTAGGSVQLGNFVSSLNGSASTTVGQAAEPLDGDYQVIRTGTGNITISASGDVLLQNQFATIYTAGVSVPDIANFSTPVLAQSGLTTLYPVQYSMAGGNVNVSAQGNIAHVTLDGDTGTVVIDSEKELPNNWLYRRGYVVQSTDPTAGAGSPGDFGTTQNGDIGSTTWWVDFSNFFEGIGALGGGNVTLGAGHDVSNVDAVVPTNTRVPYENANGSLVAATQSPVELGGGNVAVLAGNDINAGAYYVERGQGTLEAGNSILTNYTRSPSTGNLNSKNIIDNSDSWLPTTLFLGEGGFDVTAQDNLLLGPVANPFLLPQGVNNTYWDKSYFSTYVTTDTVDVASLTGAVTLRTETSPNTSSATPLLQVWFQDVDLLGTTSNTATVANYQPWVKTTETSITPFLTLDSIMPSSLETTAFSGDINLVGNLTLSPSPLGTISLLAAGSLNGLQPDGLGASPNSGDVVWSSSTIDLSDADPAAIPGIVSPYAYENEVGKKSTAARSTSLSFAFVDDLFAESGSTEGTYGVLQTKQELHASINKLPLHATDTVPVRLYASNGDISGLTLFSGKQARVIAGQDITDIALYIQNDNADDVSLVSAGRDIVAYDADTPLLVGAQAPGNILNFGQGPLAGDIQIAGPGTLEVLAGRNLNLGDGPNNSDGTGVGISSIGNESNPVLPFAGADIVSAAGLDPSAGLDASLLNFTNTGSSEFIDASRLNSSSTAAPGFIDLFLNPATGGAEAARYLPDLGTVMGLSNASTTQIWDIYNDVADATLTPSELGLQASLTPERRDAYALDVFYLVLRDAGCDHNDPSSPGAGNYDAGFAAIKALFPGSAAGASWPGAGDLSLTSREIKTTNGGNISLLVPGGQLNVGLNVAGVQPDDQGILTEDGGDVSIFADGSANVGTSRIFTLNGGNEIIWSTNGDIDAGASSKTVQSAPPTRVLVDPQSGAVETDLAGLATGGGIGVLQTRKKSKASNVDLIAPKGVVNAGDAGIRASGNLNIAAVQVLNASNIQVGGKSSGVPTVASVNVAGLTSAANVAGAAQNAANDIAQQPARQQSSPIGSGGDVPSLITVEVIGYGGDED